MNLFKAIGKVTGSVSSALVEYAETIEDAGKLIHNEVTSLIEDQKNDMVLATIDRKAHMDGQLKQLGLTYDEEGNLVSSK
jgi:hypothetical protein